MNPIYEALRRYLRPGVGMTGDIQTNAGPPAPGNNGTVTSVTATSPILSSGGNTPDISMANSGVTAGTYGNATLIPAITVSAKGVITAAANATPSFSSTAVGIISMDATADQSITSNVTLRDLSGLNFPIAANARWQADWQLYAGDNGGATGLQVAMTVPVGATMELDVGVVAASVLLTGAYAKRTTVSGTACNFSTTEVSGGLPALVFASAWINNGANAGTVALQGAQSASSGTSLTFRKGSHGLAVQRA